MTAWKQWGRGLLVAVGMAAVPALVLASDARIEGLGIDGIYLEDYENLLLFPTVIASSGNRVAASLGTGGATVEDNYFGVIAGGDQGRYGTFAVFLRGESPFMGMGPYDAQVNPAIDIVHQQYDLGWAKKVGGTVTVGARFEAAHSRDRNGDEEVSPGDRGPTEWNSTAFDGGVRVDTHGTDFLEVGGGGPHPELPGRRGRHHG